MVARGNYTRGKWGVFFDDSNAVFPFAKVSKQFENGHDGGDSISSFFEVIGPVFRKRSGGLALNE